MRSRAPSPAPGFSCSQASAYVPSSLAALLFLVWGAWFPYLLPGFCPDSLPSAAFPGLSMMSR
eukprot:6252456-Karenia_brevis.AAC.1